MSRDTAIALDSIRTCLEGLMPSLLASCSRDGTPNITYVSQVHYIDSEHVALSYQFFNKTRRNILESPFVQVFVGDTQGTRYLLRLQYLRTEEQGPAFESMRARLAGIASHSGMTGIFRLRGADIYRVLDIEGVAGPTAPRAQRSDVQMAAVRQIAARIAAAIDLRALFDDALLALQDFLGIRHSKLLLLDASKREPLRLYTVATRGYEASGVGSEIPLGHGVIGVAAKERVPIRIMHFATEWTYSLAAREKWLAAGSHDGGEREIPLPGLPEPGSQVAVPIVLGNRVIGVLYAESEMPAQFTYEHEDALLAVAAQLGATMVALQSTLEHGEDPHVPETRNAPAAGHPVTIRRFAVDDSVFVDDQYLIKGVAGAILWKLAREHVSGRRSDFTNRELRLDPSLHLPAVGDNLEARLILLARRLEDRAAPMRIVKTGRGRFRLDVARPLELAEVA